MIPRANASSKVAWTLAGLTLLACFLFLILSDDGAGPEPSNLVTGTLRSRSEPGDAFFPAPSEAYEEPNYVREEATTDPIQMDTGYFGLELSSERMSPRAANLDASIGGLVTCPKGFVESAVSVELELVEPSPVQQVVGLKQGSVMAVVNAPVELSHELSQVAWSVTGIAAGRYRIVFNGSVAQYEIVKAGQNFFFTDLSSREGVLISFVDASTGAPVSPRTVFFLETLGDDIPADFSVGVPTSNALVNPGDSLLLSSCLTPQLTVRASSPNHLTATKTFRVSSNSFHVIEMEPALIVRLELRNQQGVEIKRFPDPFAASGIVLTHKGVSVTPVSQGMDRDGIYAKFPALDMSESLPEIELPPGIRLLAIEEGGRLDFSAREIWISAQVVP